MQNIRKIFFITNDSPNKFGGTTTFLVRLLSYLKSQGWNVVLAVLVDKDEKLGEASRDCLTLGISVEHHVRGTARSEVGWLLDMASKYQPEIVVAYESASACYAACQLKKEIGVHSVRIGHTDDATEARFTNAFSALQDERAFSVLIPVSKTLEAKYAAVSSSQTTICRIPYGAPDPGLKASWSDHTFTIVYVGRLLQYQKRIIEVTGAFITACERNPSLRAVFIGDGPEAESVYQAVNSSSVSHQIILKGRMPANDVAEEVAQCQAIVLLSDFEGIPVAIMEAMAMGVVPVLLYSDSGIPELVQHGVNGLLCHDRYESFQSCITEISSNQYLWTSLSQAARAHYDQDYDQDKALNTWHKVLSSLEKKDIQWEKAPKIPAFPPNQWKVRMGDSSMATGFAKLPYYLITLGWSAWFVMPAFCRKLLKSLLPGKVSTFSR